MDDKDGTIWGPATVTYPDWRGTAQLDQRMTADGLEEAVGLDRDKWIAVGFDIGGGEHSHEMRVLALPRDQVPEGAGDVFPKVATAAGGELQVTEFLIHDRDPYEILRAITHVFELRMRVSGAREIPIRVMGYGDVPEQEL